MSTISDILLETFNNVVELQTNICERNFASVIIPKEVKNVGNYAFAGCEDLTKVDFSSKPNSIADTAFFNCQNLAEINAPWRIGGIPGAPWGAENAVINYLPITEDISLIIERDKRVDIFAPTGYNSSANAYIEHKRNGDTYVDTFIIEADSSVLYIYTGISDEFGFYTDFIEVNLNHFNSSTGKYYYSNEVGYPGVQHFEQTRNEILNHPDYYPIEYFILFNTDNSGYNVGLLGGNLSATHILETVGYTYTYNISLSGNLPTEETDVRLTDKTDGTHVDGLMSNTCSETFDVDCYDTNAIYDEDILLLSYSDLIKNSFLKFAYEKAYLLLEQSFYEPIENVFEITY